MQTFPNISQRFLDAAGRIIQPWMGYLQQFTTSPTPISPVTVSGSPFFYTAKEPGNLYITGGTVSDISLIRGSVTISLANSTTNPRLIPVAVNDIVKTTYSILPTIKFIPQYGQNTTS